MLIWWVILGCGAGITRQCGKGKGFQWRDVKNSEGDSGLPRRDGFVGEL